MTCFLSHFLCWKYGGGYALSSLPRASLANDGFYVRLRYLMFPVQGDSWAAYELRPVCPPLRLQHDRPNASSRNRDFQRTGSLPVDPLSPITNLLNSVCGLFSVPDLFVYCPHYHSGIPTRYMAIGRYDGTDDLLQAIRQLLDMQGRRLSSSPGDYRLMADNVAFYYAYDTVVRPFSSERCS